MTKIFLISVIIYFIYVFLRSIDSMQMLQQNKYNRKKTYLKWLKKNPAKAFKNYSIFFIILAIFIFYDNIIFGGSQAFFHVFQRKNIHMVWLYTKNWAEKNNGRNEGMERKKRGVTLANRGKVCYNT